MSMTMSARRAPEEVVTAHAIVVQPQPEPPAPSAPSAPPALVASTGAGHHGIDLEAGRTNSTGYDDGGGDSGGGGGEEERQPRFSVAVREPPLVDAEAGKLRSAVGDTAFLAWWLPFWACVLALLVCVAQGIVPEKRHVKTIGTIIIMTLFVVVFSRRAIAWLGCCESPTYFSTNINTLIVRMPICRSAPSLPGFRKRIEINAADVHTVGIYRTGKRESEAGRGGARRAGWTDGRALARG